MSESTPQSPEKKEVLDDNARKFTLDTLDTSFLEAHGAVSFVLTTDWLETDEETEKKLAYKKYTDGKVQILLIEKVTVDGNRTSHKEPLSEEAYAELLQGSILHIEKTRFEFTYPQGETGFSLKYDEFADSALRVLEVDADDEDARNSFNPEVFPAHLAEVTGDLGYYGYRVAGKTTLS